MNRVFLLVVLVLFGCAGGSVNSRGTENVNKSAMLHTELAVQYYQRNQMGIALSEIDQALKADANYAPAYNVRGLINMALHQEKDADDDFLRSLHLNNSDSDSQNNYGWFLCQNGREKDSIAHFMAAVKNPLYATPERAYLNAGLCYQKAGENKTAVEFLQRALDLQGGMHQALLALAQIKFLEGDYVAADKYFTQQKSEELTAEQLWLGINIARRIANANAEASYALQLRQRYPEARETQLLLHGE
jgi:type IV pilus assembly protein PilF